MIKRNGNDGRKEVAPEEFFHSLTFEFFCSWGIDQMSARNIFHQGIIWGFLSWTIIKLAAGKRKDVSITLLVIDVFCVLTLLMG